VNASLLHDLLDRSAEQTPDAYALTSGDRSWSFAELRDRTIAVAGWLQHHGVGRQDRVLILDHNNPETVMIAFAASRLGAAFAVISDQIRPYHLGHVLADCAPRIVVATAGAAAGAQQLTEAPVVQMADAPLTSSETDMPRMPCLPTDLVSLIYTSGSTALPKAVVSTHQQVLFAAAAIGSRLEYQADDVVFCCLPLSFDYGLYQVFLSCAAGARLVLDDESGAGPALLRRLIEAQATVLPLVPHLGGMLGRLIRRADQRPSLLRMVTNTGAALPGAVASDLRALMPGLSVVAMFGLTECKRVSIAEPDLDLTRPGSVGRPLPGTEVLVVDAEENPRPPGEIGELIVRGPHVMAGYWNSPELTAARFRRDYLGRTSLHTGDYCWLDKDGYLYFAGRGDDIYKQNGFRVSATEVEAAAADIPGVELAAVLTPDGQRGAVLVVTGLVTEDCLAAELRARLEERKLPASYRVTDTMPLNVNGKIDKRALREKVTADRRRAAA
jgi:acyl-CoA synthetase (AMP-forming)/AMP-acid ligase II